MFAVALPDTEWRPFARTPGKKSVFVTRPTAVPLKVWNESSGTV
jgi:hypothetical protein